MEIAQRLDRFAESQTIKMSKLGRDLRAKGFDIIDLSIGEPDFVTPDPIRNAAKEAIDEGYTHYTPVPGYPELRKAVCQKLKRDNNLDYTPDQIVVSTGAKHSLANVILALINPGDEVIIPTPYWVSYSDLVKFAQGEVRLVHCGIESGFKITPAQLEKAITPKTRLFMFSSPCNPSGAVYSKEELAGLAEVFRKHPHIAIISDEIYEYINYKGKHESIAQFEFLKDRMIVVNGLSKGFAMTGWRIGYIAAPLELAKACEKLQGQVTSGTNSIAQRAGIFALTSDLKPTHEMVSQFKERLAFVLKAMKEIPGLKVHEPDGAFYVFPDVSAYFGKKAEGVSVANADDLSMYLLEKGLISTVTGSAFGDPNCIRISYATSMDHLREGMKRLKDALAKLS